MRSRAFDDLGTEGLGTSVELRSFLVAFFRVSLAMVIGLSLVAISMWMEGKVSERLVVTEGPWRFSSGVLPSWIPSDFQGEIANLDRIPEQVALRSAHWQRDLRRLLEENPWIAEVEEVGRTSRGIDFRARFYRPVVAAQVEHGFLLLDSHGRVIDRVEGLELDPTWGVPVYLPHREIPWLDPGTLVKDPEVEECLAIVRLLWGARVLEKYPGRILMIDAYSDGRSPGWLWRLHTPYGVPLYWGRSPASPQVPLQSDVHKLQSLELVLSRGEKIRGAGGISLAHPEPTVVGRL